MRKEITGFASALALMAGTAFAQDTTAPAAGDVEAPAAQTEGSGSVSASPPAAEGGPGSTANTDGTQATVPESTDETGETEAVTVTTEGDAEGGMATTAGSGTQVSVDEMVGRDVVGADGEPLGEVADVIVDPETGQMQRLVISSGGFLGIGAKRVAVDMSEVEIQPEQGITTTSVTQADIEAMPEFDATAETEPLDPPPPPPAAAPAGGTGMGTPPPAAPQ